MFKTSVARHPIDEVRQEQIEAGRSMTKSIDGDGAPRSTIAVRKDYQRSPKKNPLAPKGHEAFLKALEASGATIQIEKCDGTVVVGTVRHSDKYTISVRTPLSQHDRLLRDIEPTADAFVDRVIFKHDISEFSPLPRAAEGRVQ